jgi:hypothetical protein
MPLRTLKAALLFSLGITALVIFLLGGAFNPVGNVQAGPVPAGPSSLSFCFSDGRMQLGTCATFTTTATVTTTAAGSTATVTTTVNNTTTVTTTVTVADALAPSCTQTLNDTGPPARIQVTVEDNGSGLASLVVTKSENADTVVPPFVVGTNDPVVVSSTKIDQTMTASVEFTATDLAGNSNPCTFTF